MRDAALGEALDDNTIFHGALEAEIAAAVGGSISTSRRGVGVERTSLASGRRVQDLECALAAVTSLVTQLSLGRVQWAGLAAIFFRRRLIAGLARTLNVPRGGDVHGVGDAGA